MFKSLVTRSFLAASILVGGFSFEAQAQLQNDFIIDYEDLSRFDAALDAIGAGGDPYDVLLDYYENGGFGLKLWMKRRGFSAEQLAEGIAKRVTDHPDWAKSVYGFRAKLEPHDSRLREYFANLQELYPNRDQPILPSYFIVGNLYGSGLWGLTGSYLTVGPISPKPGKALRDKQPGEPFSDYADPDLDPELFMVVAVHEMVHYYQLLEQGRLGYREMYIVPGMDTLMARAIREGAADYITYLATGLTMGDAEDVTDRHGYVIANEAAVWELFQPVWNELYADHPGWFDGIHSERPEMPFQVGYSLGFFMVEAYYEAAEDKKAAVEFILNANSKEEFEPIVAAYRAKMENK